MDAKKRGPKGPSKYTPAYLEELRPKVNFYLHMTNLSREQIAKRFGISQAVVSKLEMSRPTWEEYETNRAKEKHGSSSPGDGGSDQTEGNRGAALSNSEPSSLPERQTRSDPGNPNWSKWD